MPNPSTVDISFLILEVGSALLVLLLAFALPQVTGGFTGPVERWAGRLAQRRTATIALIGISAPLIRLLLLPVAPIPQPERHDEFSHLLAAETFASGRLTNPTHPMWTHLETFHENHRPTYMSMYPPAQGLALAAGKVVFGHPWYGVLVSVGLMCGAICWMLQGWLPPGWALLGAVLVVLRLGIFGDWMNSYWGGAVPALGGALILGALPRLVQRPRAGTAVALAFGLAVLANSRPFEGMLLGVPVAGALLVWAIRVKPPLRVIVWRIVAPASALLALAAGLMGYFNWRVYGNPLTLPYQVNRATYAVSPYFIWETPRPEPPYRHKVMREFYTACELPVFEKARTPGGFAGAVATKVGMMWAFYWGGILVIPLLIMSRRLLMDRDRQAAG